MKKRRQELSKDEILASSRAAKEYLFSLECFKNSNTVMAYLSAFNEVDTSEIISEICNTKNLVVPVSNVKTHTIIPSYITDMTELKKGAYGISEPETIRVAEINDIDLAIIPGIAFDRHGNRTGFGMGYYDRFLNEFNGIKIGLCYSFQVLDNLETEKHDIKMDMIITEKGIFNDF